MSEGSFRDGLDLLRERDLGRLFVARLVAAFGSAMAPVAMAFGVLELTGSATAMGIVIASQSAASALLQLVGGALADRTSRQRMMVSPGPIFAISIRLSHRRSPLILRFSPGAAICAPCLARSIVGLTIIGLTIWSN